MFSFSANRIKRIVQPSCPQKPWRRRNPSTVLISPSKNGVKKYQKVSKSTKKAHPTATEELFPLPLTPVTRPLTRLPAFPPVLDAFPDACFPARAQNRVPKSAKRGKNVQKSAMRQLRRISEPGFSSRPPQKSVSKVSKGIKSIKKAHPTLSSPCPQKPRRRGTCRAEALAKEETLNHAEPAFRRICAQNRNKR